jgi:transposase
MDYHQNARLTVHSREQLARTVVEQRLAVKAAAAGFQVSEKTAAKWVRRYRAEGVAGLKDRSSRPHRSPRRTSSPLVEKVLALRRLRHNGGRIAPALGLSRATVSRILRRAGLNRLRSLDPPPAVVRCEHKRPGDLIHFDIKRLARIVKPGHRIHGDRTRESRGAGYEYLHIAVDDHSRIAFAAILPDQSHRSAVLFFLMARAYYARFAISVRRALTDNGSCYRHWRFGHTCCASTSNTASPGPTPRAPTARPNASSRPPSGNGLMPDPMKTPPSDSNSSTYGCTTTTSTGPMLASSSTPLLLAPA